MRIRLLFSILLISQICFGALSIFSSPKKDKLSGGLITITQSHHEIHEGDHYYFYHTDGDFDIADVKQYILTTPNTTKRIHIISSVISSLDAVIQIYETSTHTLGAAQTIFNNDRNSLNTATATINISNNDVANGTLIFESYFGINTGVGIGTVVGGGGARGENETILKANTKYLFKITAGTDNGTMSIRFTWYEH